jgi:transposase
MENSLKEVGMLRGSWVGSTTIQHRGQQVLLGITKCGNSYVRSMLIHGARAVLFRSAGKTDQLSSWVNLVREKRGFNRAVVALANKLIRIVWVIITRNEVYRVSVA